MFKATSDGRVAMHAGARVVRDPVFVARIRHVDKFTVKPDRLVLSLLASFSIMADDK